MLNINLFLKFNYYVMTNLTYGSTRNPPPNKSWIRSWFIRRLKLSMMNKPQLLITIPNKEELIFFHELFCIIFHLYLYILYRSWWCLAPLFHLLLSYGLIFSAVGNQTSILDIVQSYWDSILLSNSSQFLWQVCFLTGLGYFLLLHNSFRYWC